MLSRAHIVIAAAAFAIAPCYAAKPSVHDGSSKEKAIPLKQRGVKAVEEPWEHGTLDHHGKLISYWSFTTPHGKSEIYFDTGASINTPGEVRRQESVRAEYTRQMSQSLKIQ